MINTKYILENTEPSPVEKAELSIPVSKRRSTGAFFTPTNVSALTHAYAKEVYPDDLYEGIWYDPCCGSGNLTWPAHSNIKELYLSDLSQDYLIDAVATQPNAIGFVYDFLNMRRKTIRSSQLEGRLLAAIASKELVTITCNPPYRTNSKGLLGGVGDDDSSTITKTKAALYIKKHELGPTNLANQFLVRFKTFAKMGMNLRLILLTRQVPFTSKSALKFRTAWDKHFSFKGGFCVTSKLFHTSAKFPIFCTIWDTSPGDNLIKVDVIDDKTNEIIGVKTCPLVTYTLLDWAKENFKQAHCPYPPLSKLSEVNWP